MKGKREDRSQGSLGRPLRSEEGRKKRLARAGVWENGFSGLWGSPFYIDELKHVAKDLAETIRFIPSAKELDDLVERNVRDALRDYCRDSFYPSLKRPGFINVRFLNGSLEFIASVRLDLREEIGSLVDPEVLPDPEDRGRWAAQERHALAWAKCLELLARKVRRFYDEQKASDEKAGIGEDHAATKG